LFEQAPAEPQHFRVNAAAAEQIARMDAGWEMLRLRRAEMEARRAQEELESEMTFDTIRVTLRGMAAQERSPLLDSEELEAREYQNLVRTEGTALPVYMTDPQYAGFTHPATQRHVANVRQLRN
jgi:hypothetical protein